MLAQPPRMQMAHGECWSLEVSTWPRLGLTVAEAIQVFEASLPAEDAHVCENDPAEVVSLLV